MAAGKTVTVISTIIARNSAPADADVSGTTAASNDLIGQVSAETSFSTDTDNVKGTVAAPVNPLLSALGLHDGGSTATMLLSFLSPAIDTGGNPDTLTTDAKVNPRVIGASSDIGAVQEA